MAAGGRYWVVSLPVQQQTPHSALWSRLQGSISSHAFDTSVYRFIVPDLRVGTLDSLLALSDDLVKSNSFVEGVSHKIQRQIEELEKVSGGEGGALTVDGVPVDSYLTRFVWDEARYPKMSPLREIVDVIHSQVTKIEDDLKIRASEYNNIRSQLNAIKRKQAGSLAVRDLSDLVKAEDIITSEHLVTLLAIVPKYSQKDWLSSYETLTNFVVPRSSKKLHEDNEYALYTVTLFTRVADNFKTSARERGFQIREFESSSEAQESRQQETEKLMQDQESMISSLLQWCYASYGEMETPPTNVASGGDSSFYVPPGSTDPAWQFGYLSNRADSNTVTCRLCKKVVKGGIYRFKQHLAHRKGNVAACPKVDEETKKMMISYLDDVARKKSQKAIEVSEMRDEIDIGIAGDAGSAKTLSLMRKFTNKRDIARPGQTRFATTFLTLESILEKKDKLRLMFSSDEWRACKWYKTKKGEQAASIVFSPTFWNHTAFAIKIFTPLVRLLRVVDADCRPSMGFVYGGLEEAKREIIASLNSVESSYKFFVDAIISKTKGRLDTPLHLAAYFLNPYFFFTECGGDVDIVVKRGFMACMERFYPDLDIQDAITTKELLDYRHGRGAFGKPLAVRQRMRNDENFDPANWWYNYGDDVPHLKDMAIKILSLTSASSGCERNWSTFDSVFSSWMHFCAVRVFTESILRYGLPPSFLAVLVSPPAKSEKKVRTILEGLCGTADNVFWRSDDDISVPGIGAEAEAHPYVCFTINVV